MAVELSRGYRDAQRRGPFGAVVVAAGEIAGTAVNQVIELHDPTARALGRHVFTDVVLYASAEPCPMYLAASYWARVPRVVFAERSCEWPTAPWET